MKKISLFVLILLTSFSIYAQIMVIDPPDYNGSFESLLRTSIKSNSSFTTKDFFNLVNDKVDVGTKWCIVGTILGASVVDDKYGFLIDASCGYSKEFVCVVFIKPVYFPVGRDILIWCRYQLTQGLEQRIPFFTGDYWKINDLQSW